jgi:hypothetical protein
LRLSPNRNDCCTIKCATANGGIRVTSIHFTTLSRKVNCLSTQ